MATDPALSELIAITFADEDRAAEVLDELRRLQAERLIELECVCTITRNAAGKVDLHQALNSTTTGGGQGTLWSTLIGSLFLTPLVGLVVAAATGALTGHLTEYGVNDRFIRDLGNNLQPGSSAVFAVAPEYAFNRTASTLSEFGGAIVSTSLAPDAEQRLCERLRLTAPAAVN